MRVCIEKSTGRLIEMQSDATPGTLVLNAVNAGFVEADIEEKEITQAEWQAIQDAQPKPEPQPNPDVELANAINSATTLDELKKALTGNLLTGQKGKVKGQII